jgi:hypothetical protein
MSSEYAVPDDVIIELSFGNEEINLHLVVLQPIANAPSPLRASLNKTSHRQIHNWPIKSAVLEQISIAQSYTEGETVENHCAAAGGGEGAIASGCTP